MAGIATMLTARLKSSTASTTSKPGEDVGPARLGAGADVERRGGHRAADRHALEQAGADVGRALADKVT